MRFALVDLANLFARAQHATRGDAFTKAGMALHIVFRSLRKLHKDMAVDHLVFCAEGRSWRYDVYPDYKARRRMDKMMKSEREKEEDEVFYDVQKGLIEYLAEKTRCTVLQSQGVEGDDFIARWIQLHPNDEHVILSGDSDFLQLLGPNVTIVDGVQERIITTQGVRTYKGEECVFSVDSGSGKLKVPGTVQEAEEKHRKDQKARKKAKPSYEPTAFSWTPPDASDEWWRKALFVKCIRGDAGDGIFSAYPGARFEGTSKKTGIREAWEDREAGGFHWNNFMLQRWSKLVGSSPEGTPITKDVTVKDEFAFNERLIDLTKQPDQVKDLMDTVIVQAAQKQPVGNVGIHFMKFCAKHELPNLLRESTDHAAYLNAPYSR